MQLLLLSLLPAVLVAQSIVDLAVATPQLSTLVAVLTNPAYKSVLTALSGKGPFTVFAPTNDALAAAGIDVTNVAAVTNVLQYHVLKGAVMAKDLKASQAPVMLNGARAIIKSSSSGVTAAGANVVVADVKATNGVVHLIDKVMLPPSSSIVELAVATPFVSTLVSVLTMPAFKNILDALSGEGPFTVFAPTNNAFNDAGVDLSDTATVAAVLKYHVLQGAVYSDDLQASQDVATLNGAKLTVQKSAGGVTVNNAAVIVADVAGTNGVVHVIDKVLLPPSKVAPAYTAAVARPVMSSLYSAAPFQYSAPVVSSLWGGYSLPTYSAPVRVPYSAPVTTSSGSGSISRAAPLALSWGGYFAPEQTGLTRPWYSTSTSAYNFNTAPISSQWNYGSNFASPFVSSGWGGVATPYSAGFGFGR